MIGSSTVVLPCGQPWPVADFRQAPFAVTRAPQLIVPVWPVEGFYCLCVEVFYGLLVASADTVLGTGVPIEGVDGLGDAHL